MARRQDFCTPRSQTPGPQNIPRPPIGQPPRGSQDSRTFSAIILMAHPETGPVFQIRAAINSSLWSVKATTCPGPPVEDVILGLHSGFASLGGILHYSGYG